MLTRAMFTSNMSWDFIQLRCSTGRKLTRADVHFEHELGLHPTLIAALAAFSLDQLRFRLAGGSRPLVPDDMCKLSYSRNKSCSLRTKLGLHPTLLQYLLHAHALELLRTRPRCCSSSPSPCNVTSNGRGESHSKCQDFI